MSDFIKQQSKSYEDGKVYYEFTQEDLISYKEVVHVPSEIFDHDNKVRNVK